MVGAEGRSPADGLSTGSSRLLKVQALRNRPGLMAEDRAATAVVKTIEGARQAVVGSGRSCWSCCPTQVCSSRDIYKLVEFLDLAIGNHTVNRWSNIQAPM